MLLPCEPLKWTAGYVVIVQSQDYKVFAENLRLMERDKRQLVINKGSEKFIFRYQSGSEDILLNTLIDQVNDKRTSFDWFDAAVLSFKLTQSLIGEAEELLRDKRNTRIRFI